MRKQELRCTCDPLSIWLTVAAHMFRQLDTKHSLGSIPTSTQQSFPT